LLSGALAAVLEITLCVEIQGLEKVLLYDAPWKWKLRKNRNGDRKGRSLPSPVQKNSSTIIKTTPHPPKFAKLGGSLEE